MKRVARATAQQLGLGIIVFWSSYYDAHLRASRLSGLCLWDSELHYFSFKKDRSPPYTIYALTALEKREFASAFRRRTR